MLRLYDLDVYGVLFGSGLRSCAALELVWLRVLRAGFFQDGIP